MKLWIIPFAVLLFPAPRPDDDLKRETLCNSLQRFTLPHLPYGAICAVSLKDTEVRVHVSWAYDLDSRRCATLKAALDKAAESIKKEDLAPAAAKALWPPSLERDLAAEVERLGKALDVAGLKLAVGATIDFTWNGTDYSLATRGTTKEWGFQSR